MSLRLLKGNMFFLLPKVSYDLSPGVFSLLDRPEGGKVTPLMPRCNTYGLQGTEFLDPPPVLKSTARGRSWMMVGPPFGDFSPDEPGVFDEEDEDPQEQGRTSPRHLPKAEGRHPRVVEALG